MKQAEELITSPSAAGCGQGDSSKTSPRITGWWLLCPVCGTGEEEEEGLGQVPPESCSPLRGLGTQCPPPSELAVAQEMALPPHVVIIFVYSVGCVFAGVSG